MSIREWLNNHTAAATTGTVIVLVIVLAILSRQFIASGVPTAADEYFIDTQTGTIFYAKTDRLPPIEAPSGQGNGAMAFIYSCQGCPSYRRLHGATVEQVREAGAFVGYLFKYTDDAIAAMDEPLVEGIMSPDAQRRVARGTLLMNPEAPDAEWVVDGTPAAVDVRRRVSAQCPPGQRPVRCEP